MAPMIGFDRKSQPFVTSHHSNYEQRWTRMPHNNGLRQVNGQAILEELSLSTLPL